MDPQEEIVRLLIIQLRREAASQTDAILELNKAGFGPSRIADLLGTTSNTVNVALATAKKSRGKTSKSNG